MRTIITHVDDSNDFQYISAINSKFQDIITPEELSSCICIGLDTAAYTLEANTLQYICTTGLLTKHFCTDKADIQCKQVSQQYDTFYTDFLKVKVTSIRGYCRGVLYNNKIEYQTLFPCESDKVEETGE